MESLLEEEERVELFEALQYPSSISLVITA
jgi:hypothetical protein